MTFGYTWDLGCTRFFAGDLKELTALVNRYIGEQLTDAQLKDFLKEQGLAYECGEKCIIPAGFEKVETENLEELNGIYERAEPFGEIKFFDIQEAKDFYHKLILRFGEDLKCSDRYCSLIQRDGDEVGLIGSGTKIELRITGSVKCKLYHEILVEAQKLQQDAGYSLRFNSGLGSTEVDSISPPSPVQIETWEYLRSLGL